MNTERDPYGDNRPMHLARFICANDGRVSPWCAKKPRKLPLRSRWAWTMPKPDVLACGLRVCERCAAAKKAHEDKVAAAAKGGQPPA